MSPGRPAAAVRAAFARRRGPGSGSRSGRSYAFTSLTPICSGHEADLAAYLTGLGTGKDSPLARLPYVHFGRWVIIDQLRMDWPGTPRRPTQLLSEYLLFTANVTGPADGTYAQDLPRSFLHELAALVRDEADAIWGHCVGYPGRNPVDAFVRYLSSSQLDTVLFHIGYPDVTVQEVREALAARDGLVGFARDHQGETDPVQLRQDYLEESATWFP